MNNKRFKSLRLQKLKGSRVLCLSAFLPFFLFTFLFSFSSVSAQFFGGNSDFLEQVFSPSKSQQQVINIGNDKTSVGREVLNPSLTVDLEFNEQGWQWCFVNGSLVNDFRRNFCEIKKNGDWMIPATQDTTGHGWIWCFINGQWISYLNPGWNYDTEMGNYCWELWWDRDIQAIDVGVAQREPLLVRFTKFLLRLTIVLSVTMIIYTGIRYILAAGDEEGMKSARQNLVYIILGILLALMSYGIIILIESIGFSTLSNF